MSAPHPDAVGTLADEWIEWYERGEDGPRITLREWQRVVLRRALEVDSAGRLVWHTVVVTAPRQVGKGWLATAWALGRCRAAEHFGERQTVLHVANNLAAARRIAQLTWRWAGANGLQVARAFGSERVIWPDGSSWDITSTRAIWGATGNALADECWDIEPEVVTSALQPTMVAREQPQLWLMSTANEEATPLMPQFRGLAIGGAPGVMIAEWSADPASDLEDERVWAACQPYWDRQRQDWMRQASGTPGFRYQWLNMWPDGSAGQAHWLGGWEGRAGVGVSAAGGVGAAEAAGDRSVFGVAAAARGADGVVRVEADVVRTGDAASAWLASRSVGRVLAGTGVLPLLNGPFEVVAAGHAETRQATPWLLGAVRDGVVAHAVTPAVGAQVARSRVAVLEGGVVLSEKRSGSPVPAVRAVAWAGWSAAVAPAAAAVIW
jgi:hypothetical protein